MRRLKTYKPLNMTKEVILGTCLTWFLASGPAAAQQYAVEGQAGANVKTVYMYNVQNKTTDRIVKQVGGLPLRNMRFALPAHLSAG